MYCDLLRSVIYIVIQEVYIDLNSNDCDSVTKGVSRGRRLQQVLFIANSKLQKEEVLGTSERKYKKSANTLALK